MAVSILLNPRLRKIYATKRVHCVWKCFDDVALSEEKEKGGDADEEEEKKNAKQKMPLSSCSSAYREGAIET